MTALTNIGKNELCFYVFAHFQLGKSVTKIHEDLLAVAPESCPSFDSVARWIREFKAGRATLGDGDRPGRPSTSMTEGKCELLAQLVADDPHCTVAELAAAVNVSVGSAHTILHEQRGLRKVVARWIPHLLSAEQKQRRVQCARDILEQYCGSQNHPASCRLHD